MIGIVTTESNIDKRLVIRVNNQNVSWTKEGLKNTLTLIIADRNNELEFKISQRDGEYKELSVKEVSCNLVVISLQC